MTFAFNSNYGQPNPYNYLFSSLPCSGLHIMAEGALYDSLARNSMFSPQCYPNYNYLIDPNYTTYQFFQNMNFNSQWSNGFNWNNMFQFPWNNMFQFPWNNNNNNNNSNMTDAEKNEYTKLKDQIEKLTTLLTQARDTIVPAGNPTWKDNINNAIGKSAGNLDDAKAKLEALEKEYKRFNRNDIKKLMVQMPEVKDMLYKYGYDYSRDSFGYKGSYDTLTKATSIKREIDNMTASYPYSPTTEGLNNDNIIRVLSSWNDNANEYNRNIIYAIHNKIVTFKKADGKQDVSKQKDALKKTVQPLCTALTGAAGEFLNENRSYLSTENQNTITQLISKVTSHCSTYCSSIDTQDLKNLNTEFSRLYGLIRRCAAAIAYRKMSESYEFIDEIGGGSGDKIFDDKLFKDATIQDLKAEGFSTSGYDDIKLVPKTEPAAPLGPDEEGIPNPMTKEFLETDSRVEKRTVKIEGYNKKVYKIKDNYYLIKSDDTVQTINKPASWDTAVQPGDNEAKPQEQQPQQEEVVTKEILTKKGTKLPIKTKLKIRSKDGTTIERPIKEFKDDGDEYYSYNDSIYKVSGDTVEKLDNVTIIK